MMEWPFTKYYYDDQIKEKTQAGHGASMGETRNPYKIFVRKPEGKRPLVSYKHRWENNIKMYLEYVGRNLNDFSSRSELSSGIYCRIK
jgi:hypothetical protein